MILKGKVVYIKICRWFSSKKIVGTDLCYVPFKCMFNTMILTLFFLKKVLFKLMVHLTIDRILEMRRNAAFHHFQLLKSYPSATKIFNNRGFVK
jgi:hypothetical protein